MGRPVIPRSTVNPCKDASAPAPSWWPLDPAKTAGEIAWVKCPNGHVTTLHQRVHRVDADGVVSPSYVCTAYGCNWHVFVRLDGFGEGRP